MYDKDVYISHSLVGAPCLLYLSDLTTMTGRKQLPICETLQGSGPKNVFSNGAMTILRTKKSSTHSSFGQIFSAALGLFLNELACSNATRSAPALGEMDISISSCLVLLLARQRALVKILTRQRISFSTILIPLARMSIQNMAWFLILSVFVLFA